MRRLTGFRILGVLAGFLLCSVIASRAQSTTDGAIGGTVYDQNGAAIANATVLVRNNGTNAEQTIKTDNSGYYRVTKLQPAQYSVTVTADGFTTFKAPEVIVQVGSVTEISPKLTVGSSEQSVSVSAEAPTINTTSADFAPTLNQIAVQNLPINGGRWSSFALLTPSVVSDSNGFGLLSFRGISTLLNNNTVDGADNNQAFFSEERGRTRAGYSTPKIAVQEFQVNTSNYSAEYGRAAGGVINTVTKSGSNDIHGEAYFFDRDNDWGSMNPFTTITTQNSSGAYVTTPYKPKDWRKMTGFGVGGPAIKDKLFWFLAFDYYKRNFPGTGVVGSPSVFFAPLSDAPGKNGAASDMTNLATQIYGVANAQTKALATADYNTALANLTTMLGPVPRTGEQYILFPKVDWEINQKNHASFSVNRMRWSSPAGIQTQATNNYGIASFGNDYVKDTWGVAKLDTFITSTLSNEARFQYGRDFEYENSQNPTPYEQNTLLNTGTYTNPLGLPPNVSIAGSSGFQFGTPSFLERPAYPDERRIQYADTITWSHGNHNLKFGMDYSHVNDNSQNLYNQYGAYSYSNLVSYVSDLYNPRGCTYTNKSTGKTSAVPCYSSFQQAYGPMGFEFNTNDYAFFVQDDWKVTRRLTLNLGLRWDYEQLPSAFLANPAVPATSNMPSDKNNFGPHIGFAYDIFGDGKTALRGGYGIYYGRIINSTIYNALANTGAAGSQVSYYFSPSTAGAPTYPQVVWPQPTSSGSAPAIVYFDHNFQNPQIHEVDLTFERELPWDSVMSISYLGSFGRELPDFVDTNLPTPTTYTYTVMDKTGAGPLTSPTYTTLYYGGSRPNKAFGAMTDIFSGVNSSYNALSAQFNHRFNHFVQFGANYTWSHALDYGQNSLTGTASNSLLVASNLGLEYGNSNFDVRHLFTLNMVARSPWKVNGWMGELANGWELAPVFQAQTGLPYSMTVSGSPSGSVASYINGGGGSSRVDFLGRNSFRYPGTQVVDLRLSKTVAVGERWNVELIGEAFNLLNHVNVTGVNTQGYSISTISTPNTLTYNSAFGTVTSANSNYVYGTRQIQLGVRVKF